MRENSAKILTRRRNVFRSPDGPSLPRQVPQGGMVTLAFRARKDTGVLPRLAGNGVSESTMLALM